MNTKERPAGRPGAKALWSNSYNDPITAAAAPQGPNRRLRRKQAAQRKRQHAAALRRLHAEAAGVVEVIILDLPGVISDGRFAVVVSRWLTDIAINRPMCMWCRHEWHSWQELPAVFAVAIPWGRSLPHTTMLSALCDSCAAHPDREQRIQKALTKIWPDARVLARPHPASEAVQ
jgi:hypothetical protein